MHRRLRSGLLGKVHRDVALNLNSVALVYRAQGKYSEAEGTLRTRIGDPGKDPGCEPSRRGADPQ